MWRPIYNDYLIMEVNQMQEETYAIQDTCFDFTMVRNHQNEMVLLSCNNSVHVHCVCCIENLL